MYTSIAPCVPVLFLQEAGGGGGALFSILPFILIFGVFYLLVIRPQQKRQRASQHEREKVLNALKPGDKVITSAGIYGTIVAVKEDRVQVRIAQSVSIEMQRSAVSGLQGTDVKEAEPAK